MKCVLTAAGVLLAGVAACESTQVPSYSNADLDRVSGFRGQTGVASKPRSEIRAAPVRPSRQAERERWRREVERLERRNEPLEERIYRLHKRIEGRRRIPGVSLYFDPEIEAWKEQAERLRRRIREREDRLLERARRARVPPGWLR